MSAAVWLAACAGYGVLVGACVNKVWQVIALCLAGHALVWTWRAMVAS